MAHIILYLLLAVCIYTAACSSTKSESDNDELRPGEFVGLVGVDPNAGSYPLNDIIDESDLNTTGFSGFYRSPIAGINNHYYSESGSLTITQVENNALQGTVESTFFYLAPTGPDTDTRIYTPIEIEFFAQNLNK